MKLKRVIFHTDGEPDVIGVVEHQDELLVRVRSNVGSYKFTPDALSRLAMEGVVTLIKEMER